MDFKIVDIAGKTGIPMPEKSKTGNLSVKVGQIRDF